MRANARVWCASFVVALGAAACGSSSTDAGQGVAGAPSAGGGSTGTAGSGVSGSATAGSNAAGAAGSSAGSAGVGTSGSSGTAGASAGTGGGSAGAGGAASKTTFFVTSDTSMTANLGGLAGADARCQKLALAAGVGDHTFHAYLSVEHDPANPSKALDARDRIGTGPWYNSLGVLLAKDLTALHALSGNADLFLDEKGHKINGQWVNSPTPNEHDVLTGSTTMGTLLAGQTCVDWTSASTATTTTAQVGHCDGLGPNHDPTPPYNSWNSAHANGSCGDTAPKGGAGRLYCFAIN